MPQGFIASSCMASCPAGPQGPSLQTRCLASQPPAPCPLCGWITCCPYPRAFSAAAACPSWRSASPLSPQCCRVPWDSKALSCQGCAAQTYFSLALGTAAFALFVGTSFIITWPPASHSSMPLLSSTAFPHKGSHLGVPGFHVTSLPLALMPHLRCCGPNVHYIPWPGAQAGGAPCAITEL